MWNWLLKLFGLDSSTPSRSHLNSGHHSSNASVKSAASLNQSFTVPDVSQMQLMPYWYKEVQFKIDELPLVGEENIDDLEDLSPWIRLAQDEVTRLAPRPSSSFELFQKLSDPNITPQKLADLASKDPMLASRILKTVNSAIYGLKNPVTALGRAIVLLGTNNLRSIALLHSAESDKNQVRSPNEKLLWKHSIAVSAIAYNLAEKVPGLDAHEVSTLALLHDLGKILQENTAFVQSSLALKHKPKGLSPEIQDALLGSCVAHAWGVPDSICKILETHAHVRRFGLSGLDYEVRRPALVLFVANFLAGFYGFGDGEDLLKPNHNILQTLGLSDDYKTWLDVRGSRDVEKALAMIHS